MRIAINCRSILLSQRTGIGRYTYRTKEYEAFQLRPGTAPGAMAAGPGGHMLFTTADGFGRFAPDGQITRLPVHAGHLRPLDLLPNLAVGKLYFTERDRTLLGALTLGEPGKLTEEGALCGGPPWPIVRDRTRPHPRWQRRRSIL